MKVFYVCYGSAHTSVLSAAIHTGMIGTERVPRTNELLSLPHFDKTDTPQIGTIFPFGQDDMGNEVYIIGMASHKKIVLNYLTSLLADCGVPATEYVFINSLQNIKLPLRVGGFLSRHAHLVSIGRPMIVRSIKKVFFDFVDLVMKTKRGLRSLID